MKRMDQINVIPFIDIMLVLLAIVLTTATFISEGRLEIRLPESDRQGAAPDIAPVEIGIDADNAVFIDSLPLPIEALGGHLDALARDTPIVLRVDAKAHFESFISVVDQLKGHGLEKLTILTRQP